MKINKFLQQLFVFLLICRIWSFGGGGQSSTASSITEWLRDKKVISVTQTSAYMGAFGGGDIITYITIIAEEVGSDFEKGYVRGCLRMHEMRDK